MGSFYFAYLFSDVSRALTLFYRGYRKAEGRSKSEKPGYATYLKVSLSSGQTVIIGKSGSNSVPGANERTQSDWTPQSRCLCLRQRGQTGCGFAIVQSRGCVISLRASVSKTLFRSKGRWCEPLVCILLLRPAWSCQDMSFSGAAV